MIINMHFGKPVFLCIAGSIIAQHTFLIVTSVNAIPKNSKIWAIKKYKRIKPLKEKAKKKAYLLAGDVLHDKSSKKAFEEEKVFLKQLIIEALASFERQEKSLIKNVSKKHVLSGQVASPEPKDKDGDKKRKRGEMHDAQ